MSWNRAVTRRQALVQVAETFDSIEDFVADLRQFKADGNSGIENYLSSRLDRENPAAETDCEDTVATLKEEVAALAAKVAAL